MPIADVILYPAKEIHAGDVIVTGNLNNPPYFTVIQINRLTFCYE